MSFFSKKETEIKPSGGGEPLVSSQLSDLKARAGSTDLPPYVAKQVNDELDRLETTDPVAAEFSIGTNYIELLLSLPWFKETRDNLDLNRAELILSSHHYGLDAVKERVLEFLAAKTLKKQEKSRILIVDDEQVARDNLQHYFKGLGHSVQGAANGVEALQQVEDGDHFDVVITDLKMDQMDGLTLIDDVNEELGTHFSDPYYDTIAGYFLGILGRIPQNGDTIERDGVRLTVEKMDGRRIERLRITPLSESAKSA